MRLRETRFYVYISMAVASEVGGVRTSTKYINIHTSIYIYTRTYVLKLLRTGIYARRITYTDRSRTCYSYVRYLMYILWLWLHRGRRQRHLLQ